LKQLNFGLHNGLFCAYNNLACAFFGDCLES